MENSRIIGKVKCEKNRNKNSYMLTWNYDFTISGRYYLTCNSYRNKYRNSKPSRVGQIQFARMWTTYEPTNMDNLWNAWTLTTYKRANICRLMSARVDVDYLQTRGYGLF